MQTVMEVRIVRPEWLASDGKRLWITARVGINDPYQAALLVDLETSETLAAVKGIEPICWLNDSEVLFWNSGSEDPLLTRIGKTILAQSKRKLITRFYRLNIQSGQTAVLTDFIMDTPMNSCAVSTTRKNAVITWGPLHCRELNLETGESTDDLAEKYVWSPCFVDGESYLFIGETVVHSRKVGEKESRRVSQPLLKEIRDAINKWDVPTLSICGPVGKSVVLIDQVPAITQDRLMILDLTRFWESGLTSLTRDLTNIKSGKGLPRINPSGTYLVYQGQQFDGDMDSVYLQKLEPDSPQETLIKGETGMVNESNPIFLDETTILYVHRGTELRSLVIGNNEPRLHWPITLANRS